MIVFKEDTAEFIVKNIIFIVLFGIFGFFGISSILIPKIEQLKTQQDAHQQQKFFETRLQEQNKEIANQIQQLAQANESKIAFLQKDIKPSVIEEIGQDFFEVLNVSAGEVKKDSSGPFIEVFFHIKGKINGTKALFDFAQKIKQTIPSATLVLPVNLYKTDPLKNTLNVEVSIKFSKLIQTKSKR